MRNVVGPLGLGYRRKERVEGVGFAESALELYVRTNADPELIKDYLRMNGITHLKVLRSTWRERMY